MADLDTSKPLTMGILKHSKILVHVEEALPDVIVVTYNYESKIFQGVLLDSTKNWCSESKAFLGSTKSLFVYRNFPCGISPSVNQMSQLTSETSKPLEVLEEDKLLNLNQRYTYFQNKLSSRSSELNNHKYLFKRQIRTPARFKNSRMNIRLRPRQVLCSKCRSICNENSENVDFTQKQRCLENNGANNIQSKLVGLPSEIVSNNKSPRPLFSENQRDNQPMYATSLTSPKDATAPLLIPKVKIPRLQPSEIANALIGNTNNIKIVGNYWVRRPEQEKETIDANKDDADGNLYLVGPEMEERMVLRKKRSVGSMEDLWDESVLDDTRPTTQVTPIIKISFGRQGEGTVLKIPSRPHGCHSHSDMTRAAKRAIKKAKKEARKKLQREESTWSVEPQVSGVSMSESDAASSRSRHRPKRNKVKHKKKHKEERKKKDSSRSTDITSDQDCNDLSGEKINDDDLKEDCLRQTLSINLSRVNTTAYQCDVSNSSKSPTSSELSDDQGEAVPNFPPPETRLMEQSLDSCVTSDGRQMVVGDIVWGKIHGFPWWPGKVLSITVPSANEGEAVEPRAHVSWYGSSTSSDMSCDHLSPFLKTFKLRYNKKKRGPYKEAIRQATSEAEKEISRYQV